MNKLPVNNTITGTINCVNFQTPKLKISFGFEDIGTLNPLPDITPLESVLISMMVSAGMYAGKLGYGIDAKGWVEKHKLGRHFTNG